MTPASCLDSRASSRRRLGGLGSGFGSIFGGLVLGLFEAMTAGYVSSAYKDAVPFVLVLIILLVRPQGLFGAKQTDRV
jgi:branched-chain amino acid transport system permease protein